MRFKSRVFFSVAAAVVLAVGILFGVWLARDPRRLDTGSSGTGALDADANFTRLMHGGRAELEGLKPEQAVASFRQAAGLRPTEPDAHLNLANACLQAGQPEQVIAAAREVLGLDPTSAAAHYVIGCAHLRLAQFEPALQALQQALDADRDVTAVHFQIGLAHQGLGHWAAAAEAFGEVVAREPDHPSAYYPLSQVLIRLGRRDEAQAALERHKVIAGKQPNVQTSVATYERSRYTQVRVPFQPSEQPAAEGVGVMFTDATAGVLGAEAKDYRNPAALRDPGQDTRYGIFLFDVRAGGFRLLRAEGTSFRPAGDPLPARPGVTYGRCLVGDLQNDGTDDVLVPGDTGSHAFTLSPSGAITDVSESSGLAGVRVHRGALADLDFTGKLSLWAVTPDGQDLRLYRNQGNLTFKDMGRASAVPADAGGFGELVVHDWNTDDLPDLFVARAGPPLLLLNRRGGAGLTAAADAASGWPAAAAIAIGDLDGDLRPDLISAGADGAVDVLFGGTGERARLPAAGAPSSDVTSLTLVDYDNDGWPDVCAAGGRGLRAWRNLARAGFRDVTAQIGLDKLAAGPVTSATAADLDADGDTDLLLDVKDAGLKLLRNDGGNANRQLKLRLVGKRSNATGIGSRVEVVSAGWRTSRTIDGSLTEIGTGRHAQLDAITVHWYDLMVTTPAVNVEPAPAVLTLTELELPTGSCPYLYAWDGRRFRFVTDLLGASPLGLRLTQDRFVEPDPDELVWVGDESQFKPKDGQYVLQITEELREVLYLDQASLVAVDRPAGAEVHPTSKLRPGKPFPPPELWTLHQRRPLLRAESHLGADVTGLIAEADGRMLSPARLRVPQLRGLAEPHGVTLDFAALPSDRPLVLALTGWLRFGGGMANVAASHHPDLPFPFPTLEAEVAGKWQPVDVVVGAPAGKTKTILVDLGGRLPPGARRLRLTAAFEIHWDRVALFERDTRLPAAAAGGTAGAAGALRLAPTTTDLHWHGFGRFEDRPWDVPLTPIFDRVSQSPRWLVTPSGWHTRYGDVNQLVAARDNALAVVGAGDGLTLRFPADQLPAKPARAVREFFLFTSGWDKDADYHVAHGWTVEPLPFHSMDAQLYGRQSRPPAADRSRLMNRYNTRWVGFRTLRRDARPAADSASEYRD